MKKYGWWEKGDFEWIWAGELRKASIFSIEKEAVYLWAQGAILDMPCSFLILLNICTCLMRFVFSLWHLQAFSSSMKGFTLHQQNWRQTIFLCFCPLPFLKFYPTYYSPQTTVKVFLAKKGLPNTVSDEQLRGEPGNRWVGGAGMRGIWQCSSPLQGTRGLKKISSFPKSLIGF